MAINTPKATNATNASGQVIAKPILQSSPTLRPANGDTAGAVSFFRFGGSLGLAFQDGKFEPRGVPFHARVFDGW